MILPVHHVNLCNKQTNRPRFLCSLAFLKCFCIYLLYCGEWSFAPTATTWRSGDNFQWSVPSFHHVESREEMQVIRFSGMHLYPLSRGLLGYYTCGTISDNLKESSLSRFPHRPYVVTALWPLQTQLLLAISASWQVVPQTMDAGQ